MLRPQVNEDSLENVVEKMVDGRINKFFAENCLIEQKFVKEEFRPMMMMEESPARLLDRFSVYQAPRVKKWIGPEET